MLVIRKGSPAAEAETCFEAMVRHHVKKSADGGSRNGGTSPPPPSMPLPNFDDDSTEFAWGAREVAAVMMGASDNATVMNRRTKRVFNMWEEHRKAFAEALSRGRPPPPNPLGFINWPDSNRVILHIPTFRAFIASQLTGARHG
ncbi:hypothetical protein [Bradyrhizobium acaciae]|uniref:hypothetical protein n=1 Tax=Bradyrhizobium acaciae TaxID=2683706 RepID=UPI001E3DFB9C|nr:hypothetical protein [Bradyrhizobium acaciae]MCC8978881.1 hypothetical protein [Bradyrhizobium acaciae]